ncbi:type IV toxin-antitoxin system AbiEi family antitoxin domain-containing protein [Roseateles saccharophilus]|uniref:Putative AbiEi antitoxin of type IV toxin-antitoxin system n=2 Tax=Roseateles saccharophilus TaxID=304 RepID=A0A4R3U8I9_ROSSA|nr:putative AbiEi antitoxin of type IV toxin-antitoxin system [Roseateles saccharophilus]
MAIGGLGNRMSAIMKASPAVSATSHEQQVLRLARTRKLLRAREVTQHGLPTIALTRLVQAGKLERVARGLYGIPGAKTSEHRSLAEVSARVPKGVVCLLSALRVHEIGTQAPFEVWIAIPQHMVTPRLDQPAIRVVRMSDAALAEGVEKRTIDGVKVPVFNAARTVVDCFRFRNKIGLDVALEALRDGWRQRKFTLDDLWRHATSGRVANVMRPYIEAITA